MSVNLVLVIKRTNFKDYKENMKIILGYIDFDLMLRINNLRSLVSIKRGDYEKWDLTNYISLMIIKHDIH